MLDSLGGINVLFPIFAQFSLPDEDGNYTADPKLGVEVIQLISAMIEPNMMNLSFGMERGFALIAHLLERVSPEYITPAIVAALMNLRDRVAFSKNYVNEVTKHLLTNFRLWVFTPLQTQLYAFNAIAREIRTKGPSRFRSSDVLGVKGLLIALRVYYWVDSPVPHSSSDKWATEKALTHPVTGATIGRRLIGDELLQARAALIAILDLLFLSGGDEAKDSVISASDIAEIDGLLGALASSSCDRQRHILGFCNVLRANDRSRMFCTWIGPQKRNRLAGLNVFVPCSDRKIPLYGFEYTPIGIIVKLS